jgi:cytochrome c oxidase cbb3-type subunit IV
MDISDLRIVVMVLAFIAFLGICFWAYSRKRKRDFEEAARLPFSGKDFGENDSASKEKEEKQ